MSAPDLSPPKATLVLVALVTGAIVANINLGIANVALPVIGRDLGASQSQLTAIANGFALGLAASVLYLGAIGDRYGRKLLFVAGAVLTVPCGFMAAYAPNGETLAIARFLGGFAAALLFPTTLSLITSMFSGKPQVRAIALWSGLGGGVAAIGPLLGGVMLQNFWWGSVFLITLPLDVLALVIGLFVLPWKSVGHSSSVDHLGGVLSVVFIGSAVVAIQIAGQGWSPVLIGVLIAAVVGGVLFFWREAKARNPLLSLSLISHRVVWVAWVAGVITFGSLIAAMFIGQQFMQNVLGYTPLAAAAAAVPSAIGMAVLGAVSGRIVEKRGSKPAFLMGLFVVGMGVGLSVTPASRSLTASMPKARAGMGSALVDLTRDFGGAVMQAVLGVLLATVYSGYFSKAFANLPPEQAQALGSSAAQEIASSYAGAMEVAKTFPQADAEELVSAANKAFSEGKTIAYVVALAVTLIAFVLVWWRYPHKAVEEAYYAQVQAADSATAGE